MKRKKTVATKLPKEVPQQEKIEWKISLMSSKWFVILLLLLAGIIRHGFYNAHTKEIAGSDDRDYTRVARNIAHGKGIVRNFTYPLDINFFDKLTIPDFFHPLKEEANREFEVR